MKRLIAPYAVALGLLTAAGAATAAIKAGYTMGNFALELDGTTVTFLKSATGIGALKKQSKAAAGGPTPVDVKFALLPQSTGLNQVNGFLTGASTSFDSGVIKLLDMNYAVKNAINLGRTSIVELELPGADAKDGKQPLEVRMRLQPTTLGIEVASGSVKAATTPTKAPLLSNFRVSVDGAASPDVLEVAPCVVKRASNQLQITGLAVTLNLSNALSGDWYKWWQGKDAEKPLTIEYLDPTLTNTVLTVSFTGVSMAGITVSDIQANADVPLKASFQLSARGLTIN
jgi:hypothetical protein